MLCTSNNFYICDHSVAYLWQWVMAIQQCKWNLNFTISLLATLPNLISLIINNFFKKLSMIWLKFKNKNSLIFNSVNLTYLSQVAKLNSLYIFILSDKHCGLSLGDNLKLHSVITPHKHLSNLHVIAFSNPTIDKKGSMRFCCLKSITNLANLLSKVQWTKKALSRRFMCYELDGWMMLDYIA